MSAEDTRRCAETMSGRTEAGVPLQAQAMQVQAWLCVSVCAACVAVCSSSLHCSVCLCLCTQVDVLRSRAAAAEVSTALHKMCVAVCFVKCVK